MSTFIDPMAFIRGAESARDANWRDAQRELEMRMRESDLARTEASFGLQFPLAKLGAELQTERGNDALGALRTNREFAQFEGRTLQRVAGMAPAERGTLLATELATFAAQANPQQIGNITRFGQTQALNELRAGNVEGAAQILRALPGADTSGAAREVAKWRDPAQYRNADVIKAAGGVPLPNGRVDYNGVQLTPEQFAQLNAERAVKGALADVPKLLAGVSQAQAQRGERQQFVDSQLAPAYAAAGMRLLLDPVTGQTIAVPMGQLGGNAPSFPASAGTPGDPVLTPPDGTTIGVGAPAPVRQQQLSLPPGMTPSTAGAGRGSINPTLPTATPAPAPAQAETWRQVLDRIFSGFNPAMGDAAWIQGDGTAPATPVAPPVVLPAAPQRPIPFIDTSLGVPPTPNLWITR